LIELFIIKTNMKYTLVIAALLGMVSSTQV
jgi:hypothetical protein